MPWKRPERFMCYNYQCKKLQTKVRTCVRLNVYYDDRNEDAECFWKLSKIIIDAKELSLKWIYKDPNTLRKLRQRTQIRLNFNDMSANFTTNVEFYIFGYIPM